MIRRIPACLYIAATSIIHVITKSPRHIADDRDKSSFIHRDIYYSAVKTIYVISCRYLSLTRCVYNNKRIIAKV